MSNIYGIFHDIGISNQDPKIDTSLYLGDRRMAMYPVSADKGTFKGVTFSYIPEGVDKKDYKWKDVLQNTSVELLFDNKESLQALIGVLTKLESNWEG